MNFMNPLERQAFKNELTELLETHCWGDTLEADEGVLAELLTKTLETFGEATQALAELDDDDRSISSFGPLPTHLQAGAPYAKCSKCGRKSWDKKDLMQKRWCNMPQPDGSVCNGKFTT